MSEPNSLFINQILNTEALTDLFEACLSAKGAYHALKLVGADKYLDGYENCLTDLDKAISKAQFQNINQGGQ